MPNDDVTRLLATMKADEASLILDSLSKLGQPQAKRAADLTAQLRLVLPPQ